MEFFKTNSNFDFMGIRKITGSISIILCVISIFLLATKGLNIGLEFTGGTQAEVRFSKAIEPNFVAEKLEKNGLKDPVVQHYGSVKDVLIRIATADIPEGVNIKSKIKETFADSGYSCKVRRVEYVGSGVGNELAELGGLAILVAIISTMVYISLRFEYRFAISSAVALCHDAIIVLGILSYFNIEFDLATLAAILAMLGYSLNDTIVVFDRVRENFRKIHNNTPSYVMNLSINQTLSRTTMTSFLTLLVLLALLFFGGSSLFGFSLALTLGIVIGTYSSIFVAGTFAISMGLSRADLLPKPKTEIDDMP